MFRELKEVQKIIQNPENTVNVKHVNPGRHCAEFLAFITRNAPAQYAKMFLIYFDIFIIIIPIKIVTIPIICLADICSFRIKTLRRSIVI